MLETLPMIDLLLPRTMLQITSKLKPSIVVTVSVGKEELDWAILAQGLLGSCSQDINQRCRYLTALYRG